MNSGKALFTQVMEYLDHNEFNRCVQRYDGHRKIQSFTCMDQFLSMAFAQLTHRESLRDIETCLRLADGKSYHMGFRSSVSRNTLANANQTRDWRIYADFAHSLIREAQGLYAGESLGFELKQAAHALDSTTIDLCLSLFPWATFRKTKAAVKLHTVLDVKTALPLHVIITPGDVHDVNILDQLTFESDTIYILDRGYYDYSRLFGIDQAGAFFVVRAKKDLAFQRLYSHPVDKTTGVQCDQTIRFKNFYAAKDYPQKLRRVRYYDAETQKHLVFLTNHFDLSALDVARLYRCRWKIELFFKWIKQHLRIKTFFGRSDNAVKTQIWIAICAYVLVAILKKRLNLPQSLHTILQILSVRIFEKTPLILALSEIEYSIDKEQDCGQLNLFD